MDRVHITEALKGAEFDTLYLQRGESLAKHATGARDLQTKTAVSTR